jgi:hypothetical protein
VGAPPRAPWRKRHPIVARAVLYGTFVAAVVTFGFLWSHRRAQEEADRQHALLTTLDGIHQLVSGLDPQSALSKVRADVLAKSPDVSVRREALLIEASLLDRLLRYDESDAVYSALEREWPAGEKRGPLVVPWANMRISAGRVAEARAMLAVAGADEGFPAAQVAMVRARLDAKPPTSHPSPAAPR